MRQAMTCALFPEASCFQSRSSSAEGPGSPTVDEYDVRNRASLRRQMLEEESQEDRG